VTNYRSPPERKGTNFNFYHPFPQQQESAMAAAMLSNIPLIFRKLLLGNPSRLDPRLSPGGKRLAWLAPVNGVMNIWVAPADALEQATPVTQLQGRPIPWHRWTADGRWILFLRDTNGDENHNIYSADPVSGEVRNLTPLPKVAAEPLLWSPDLPGKLLAGLNDRDARWHDIWEIDLETGKRALVYENTERLGGIFCDWQGKPRLASRSSPEKGGKEFMRFHDGLLEPWKFIAFEDSMTTWMSYFNRAGTHIAMLSSAGRDTSAMLRVNLETGAEEVLAEFPDADIINYRLNPKSFEVAAVAADPGRLTWKAIDPADGETLDKIKTHLPDADFSVLSVSEDDMRWIVTAWSPTQPATYYLVDREAHSIKELFSALSPRPDASLANRLAGWPNPPILRDTAGARDSAAPKRARANGASCSWRTLHGILTAITASTNGSPIAAMLCCRSTIALLTASAKPFSTRAIRSTLPRFTTTLSMLSSGRSRKASPFGTRSQSWAGLTAAIRPLSARPSRRTCSAVRSRWLASPTLSL
jgi:hypothetical protein